MHECGIHPYLTVSYHTISALPHIDMLEYYVTALAESFLIPATPSYTYKRAAKKVHPVAASLPEDFRIIR